MLKEIVVEGVTLEAEPVEVMQEERMEIRERAQLAVRAQERTYQPTSLVRGHCNPDLVERPLLRVPVISAAEAEVVS